MPRISNRARNFAGGRASARGPARPLGMRTGTGLVVVLALAIAVPGLARAETKPTPGQKLALHAKPAVVKIEAYYLAQFSFNDKTWPAATGGEGSGFFISPDGYIVTNAHVVETIRNGDEKAYAAMKEQVLTDIIKAYVDELRQMGEAKARQVLSTVKLVDVKKFNNVVLQDGTKLTYDIKAFGAPLGGGDVLDASGKDCAIIKINIKHAPTLPIGDSEKVQLQDKIYVIGYPGAADLRNLDQKSALEASITDGAISAIKQTRDGIPLLQHSAPTAPGNSGGPALNDRNEVVGIHSAGGMGEKSQGFNFVVGAATMLEFVRQSGAKPEASETDALWRQSLDLFWDQRYTTAIGKLEEILSLFPSHLEAKKLLDESRDLKRRGKEKREDSRVGGYVVGTAVGAALLGGLVVFARRRWWCARRRARCPSVTPARSSRARRRSRRSRRRSASTRRAPTASPRRCSPAGSAGWRARAESSPASSSRSHRTAC